jgi:hypothetical protein
VLKAYFDKKVRQAQPREQIAALPLPSPGRLFRPPAAAAAPSGASNP